MENDKLFEFMEKMYVEMQKGFKEVHGELDGLKQDFNGLKQEVSGLKEDVTGLKQEVRKNSIKIESLENKVDLLAEIQENHRKENEKNHFEIVEMLSSEIRMTQNAVSKITVIK